MRQSNRKTALVYSGVVLLTLAIACTKNATPTPPTHDTVTVIKKDTLKLTDTVFGTKPDSTVNLTKGLLVYLPFSGNIADSSGNNNPTQAVGSVLTYDAHGFANNAFGGTGHGEKIYVTNNGSIKFDTAYSLSFGFTADSSFPQTYLSMVNPATGAGPSFLFGNTRPGTNSVIFGSEDVTLGCSNFGTNDNINIADTAGFVPVPGSWYSAICIYHKGTNKIYINGKLISTKVGLGTSANLCPLSKIIIGAWWDGDPQSFGGKLDNFRLYNRVLTPNEIVQLAKSYQVTSNSVRPSPRYS
jgi:hypothetical protein